MSATLHIAWMQTLQGLLLCGQAWTRALLVCAALGVTFVELFFLVDLMHWLGFAATGFLLGAPLLVLLACAWTTIDLYVRYVLLVAERSGWRQLSIAVLFAALAWAPLASRGAFPELPHHSFLWRNEHEFLRVAQTREPRAGIRHYEHGTAFRFNWRVFLSDSSYVLIYEPGRPPGSQPLERDTAEFSQHRIDFDLHLWGPWYALVH